MILHIPLDIQSIENEGYHIFVPAMINGKPARLLIDTGASRTVFDSDRIKAFTGGDDSLIRKSDKLSTGLGTRTMESALVLLHEFRLGGLFLEDYQAVALEMSHVNFSYQHLGLGEVDGVLGGDILHQYKAVIDYGRQELRLRATLAGPRRRRPVKSA